MQLSTIPSTPSPGENACESRDEKDGFNVETLKVILRKDQSSRFEVHEV